MLLLLLLLCRVDCVVQFVVVKHHDIIVSLIITIFTIIIIIIIDWIIDNIDAGLWRWRRQIAGRQKILKLVAIESTRLLFSFLDLVFVYTFV
jgi:hypothetical protein